MRFLLLAVASLLLVVVPGSAVYYGEPRDEVVRELGKPSSELRRGGRDVLIYKTGRVELENGKVAVVQGFAVTDGPAAAPVVEKVAPAMAPMNEKSVEPQIIEADVAAHAKMEKQIAEMENPPHPPMLDRGPPRWLTFIVELIVKAVMTLAALKLTTKYWEVEISWYGLSIAAVADTVTRAAVGAIALWALGMGTTMYADEATAAIILVVVLRKVSYNQSLSQAVTIALTTKTFSIVVGSFLSVFVLRAIFGGSGGLIPF